MTDARRLLVVVRHSKTEAYATTDHARTLTDRGKRDARELGRWLDRADVTPEVLLVSSAARAQQTAELAGAELGSEPEIVVVDELYGASPDEVIEICRAQLDDSVERAALVGHNPTMAGVVDLLIGSDTDEDLGHFPTSATAVIEIAGRWDSLGEGAGTLVSLYRPKNH
ncbi:MAG TPA: histidine phosphatase family protein [Nocardioidaceae bacterium]|nr:histidine phosphatase family protein [Nocardioidaceae bacterium]